MIRFNAMTICGAGLLLRFACCSALAQSAAPKSEPSTIRSGSKQFEESVILGELLKYIAEDVGFQAEHLDRLGGTPIVWQALLKGEIDAYVEYTGTISQQILSGRGLSGEDSIRSELESLGLRMSAPIGFNNTYAIGMMRETAARLGVRKISDLRDHPKLVFGFTSEFVGRGDGWATLRQRYGLPQRDVRGMEHALAYQGLVRGSIGAMDLYATDAEIRKFDLAVLEDDLAHFPKYDAVIVYRADLLERAPTFVRALSKLENAITAEEMIAMNASVKIDGKTESDVAAEFAGRVLGIRATAIRIGIAQEIGVRTVEHLLLVGVSLAAAILIAIPLGIVAARNETAGHIILAATGVIQTIPALALLVLLIQPFGTGRVPAIIALFLYGLLPIVRNTCTGLRDIPAHMSESARALGLTSAARLWRIELPIASPVILAGVKTTAVINVGFATLGALIGAGGYGDPILRGIQLLNNALVLRGAIPAAVLALLVQGLFELAERFLVPRGLRLKPTE